MSNRTACTCCKAAASLNPAVRSWRWSWSGAVTASSATPHDRRGATPMSAVVDFPVKPEARPYLDAFTCRVSGEPEWLNARRRRGLSRFAEQGFPNRRSEAWRYIDLRALEEKPMLPASPLSPFPDASVLNQLAEILFPEAAYRL